jgi:deoxyribonuclease V
MNYSSLHSWNVDPKEAIKLQEGLREKVIKAGKLPLVRRVAGVDVGFPNRDTARAAVVVLSFSKLELIERQVVEIPIAFPYIPGLLAFREASACLAAIRQLADEPDLFIFDAQGYAHPRRMGLASHLGLFLDKPSIGCAKSKLIGYFQAPGNRVGDRSDLVNRNEVIGAAVRSRPGSPPLFISVGHKISLDDAVKYTLLCIKRGNRLPETTRLAHQLASQS